MGKQYKSLTQNDEKFIKNQKLFYLASCSDKEVNLSPKGYDTIRIIDSNTLVFLNYPGSGNRTYRDAIKDGEFTLVFNSFEGDAKILRLFCKAKAIENSSEKFKKYAEQFGVNENLIRNFFEFYIYAVESSCGESVPIMEYKADRKSLKNWVKKMDKNAKLEEYKKSHLTPPDLSKI